MHELQINPEIHALLHAQNIFSIDLINGFLTTFLDHYWLIGTTSKNKGFITSDEPVVKKAHTKDPIHSTLGFASGGIEIALPLDPWNILVMKEKRHFKQLKNKDCRVVLLSNKEIEFYNTLQVLQSRRQLYGLTDHSEFIKTTIQQHPEALDVNSPTIEVVEYPLPEGTIIQFKNTK